ncbi:MAG: hypothetical protein QOD93_7386 [Acetobacteraceae bacterium]|nr:hypothetical protein [Acetobacteraceae bacterium]
MVSLVTTDVETVPYLVHTEEGPQWRAQRFRLLYMHSGGEGGQEYLRASEQAINRCARNPKWRSPLGAIHTPKVLMQSGIGDRTELQRHGIPVVQTAGALLGRPLGSRRPARRPMGRAETVLVALTNAKHTDRFYMQSKRLWRPHR